MDLPKDKEFRDFRPNNLRSPRVHPAVQQAVHNILKMLDGQFSHQNGTVNGGPPGPGISVIVAPTTASSTPDTAQWASAPIKEGKKIQVTDNMTTVDRVVLCASEAAGTAILVFLGCTGCVTSWYGVGAVLHEQICLTFGLAVMIAVQCFGHVSGSHINPLVTVAAATLGNIPLIQVPIFFVGQMLGALGGFGLLKAITPPEYVRPNGTALGVCSPGINPLITPVQGLLVEFTISLILALVCCGVWDSRNSTKHDSVAIRFGLTISCLALAAGPYTGANMNPARSFAPALINGDWAHHWVYWIGPLGGGFIGALLYRFLFAKDQIEEERNNLQEGVPLNDKP